MDYPESIRVGERVVPIDYGVAKKLTSTVRLKKGRVVLKLSRYLRGRKRDETVKNFLVWAKKKLESFKGDFVDPVYEDGGRVVTHNKNYEIELIIEKRSRSSVKLENGFLIKIFLSDEMSDIEVRKKLKDIVEKKIIEDQTEYLEEVLEELNLLHFQEKYNDVRFKRVSSRFGSCSSKRNINIAYRLLFAPREVFRYVCIHELAHLKEFNHSKRFWKLVEDAMPEYKEHEKWLKENGFMLG